jgi:hypothetical protein
VARLSATPEFSLVLLSRIRTVKQCGGVKASVSKKQGNVQRR